MDEKNQEISEMKGKFEEEMASLKLKLSNGEKE